MSATKNLHQKIAASIPVSHMEIIDESHLHAGHAGARPEGNSHFRAIIISDAFENMPRVRRHQMIYKILDQEMKTHIHALAITALTPQEYQKRTEQSS